jgi:hypothetical protein
MYFIPMGLLLREEHQVVAAAGCHRPYSLLRMESISDRVSGESAWQDEERSQ